MSGTNAHYLHDMSKGNWYFENGFTVTKGGVPIQPCCRTVKKSKWSKYVQICLCDHVQLLQERSCALNAPILSDASFSSAAFKPFTPASEPNLATKIYQRFYNGPTASNCQLLPWIFTSMPTAISGSLWFSNMLFSDLAHDPTECRTWPVTKHHRPQLSKCAQLCQTSEHGLGP